MLILLIIILLAIFKPTLLVSTVFWIAAGPLAIWAIIRLIRSIGDGISNIHIGDIHMFNKYTSNTNNTNNYYDDSKHIHFHNH